MNTLQAIIIAIIEGLTEYLPISSTAHMGFTASLMGIPDDEYLKMFQVSIQFGAILSIVVLYWRKFFNFTQWQFYFKLACAVVPALILGKLFDDKIEAVLGNQKAIAITLIIGGIILLFVDNWFKNPNIHDEKQISVKKAVTIGFWQCLAMMPGTSRSAASIIGGMTQGLTRKAAAEFSFFLAIPTMFGATLLKGYKLYKELGLSIFQENWQTLLIGNVVAFFVALLAIRYFIDFVSKYGFRAFGYYRIVLSVGIALALLFGANISLS